MEGLSNDTHIIEKVCARHLVSCLKNKDELGVFLKELKEKMSQENLVILLYFALEEISTYPRHDPKNTRLNFALNQETLALLDFMNMFPWNEILEACLDKRRGVERLNLVLILMAQKIF